MSVACKNFLVAAAVIVALLAYAGVGTTIFAERVVGLLYRMLVLWPFSF